MDKIPSFFICFIIIFNPFPHNIIFPFVIWGNKIKMHKNSILMGTINGYFNVSQEVFFWLLLLCSEAESRPFKYIWTVHANQSVHSYIKLQFHAKAAHYWMKGFLKSLCHTDIHHLSTLHSIKICPSKI